MIQAFGFDYHSKVIMLLKSVKRGGSRQKKVNKVKIYDYLGEKVLWNGVVSGEELVGRLKSGLYTLVDGHIFYNNCVIKIRYDLLR